ncbi:translocation/assembly module TamB domain-containing protein [Marinobacter sp. HL-58]|uniref:translocation/assembly module TamB domain-containing protein n=1 Tax=Marinobacter sp. HL-58 TaxID=1479237 RepID=UPI000488ADF6|nr:translocation/assembly module TamB domain-containing protein [Marinobacter sp. HL-58]KPQ02425.1 MAG: autotransporter translocation and assembly module inner membrane component TamB [Marinobacter sp. HL-58]
MTDEATAKARHPNRLRNWLLTALAIAILLPLLLVGVLLLALRSETGTAWVIDQIPGLNVEQGQGSLLGQWQARSLRWQGYGVGLVLEEPVVDWSPTCLFSKQLCLESLRAESIDLTLQPSGDQEDERGDISLPGVNLPLGLAVRDVNLGTFTVNDGKIWDQLQLQAEGSGADWHLQNLTFVRDSIRIDGDGRVQTRGDWPLNLDADINLPPPYGPEWKLALNLSGSAVDLRVQGESSGYLEATLAGRVAPLDSALPARLTVRSPSFVPAEGLPETLELKNTEVALKGSLEDGFRSDSSTTLPGTSGDIAVALEGLITTSGVDELNLSLSGPGEDEAETGEASVTGSMDWQQDFRVDATVAMADFPWYTLIPDFGQPPVSLRQLNGDIRYQSGSYQANVDASVDGPLGKADLAGELDGDMESVEVTRLRVNTGAGFLGGHGSVAFADQLAWDASLELDGFNPGYWLPALEASLDGDVNTSGRMEADGTPSVKADWDLSGNWQANDAIIRGALNSDAGAWMLSGLELEVGDNRITGNGQWGNEIAGNLAMEVPSPETFLPGLAGSLSGTASVSGTPDQPQGEASVSGTDLAWQDELSLASLDLNASLGEGLSVDADVQASELRYGEQLLESLTLGLSGTRDDHRLEVGAVHEEAELGLVFAGDASGDWKAWRGALEQGRIDIPRQDQQWTLAEPASLELADTGKLTFGRHCWRWQEASVCAEDQTLLPTQDIAYRIENFPTTALTPLLPETLRWDALLNADIRLAMTEEGPDGEVSVDAGSGEFEVMVGDEWEALGYDTFTTGLRLQPEVAELDVRLEGPELGDLSVSMAVDPDDSEREVDGEFRVRGLDIAMAGVFAGLEVVEGELNGEGSLSGPLLKPGVSGEIALTGGRISDPRLPIPLEDMVVSLELNGYSSDLSGRWRSNERSTGNLKGALDWEGEPSVEINLTGDRLPFSYDPYARVELVPDLTISYSSGDLGITGRLEVPRGEIEIRALPEQAVSVSEDEVIVGVEQEEEGLRSLNMDVTVVVGDDQVSFDGFGVTGNLEGTLRIGNDMDTRGALQLIDGQYEAYGQELELRRARLQFVGPLTEPYLDIEAVRRVDNVVAGIRLSGPVSAPQTEVFSEPEMPQTDALSYVILGRAPQSRGDEGQMSRAAISLGLTQANKVTQGLGEEIGIRNLTLEAEGSGEESAVVASGYLTDELSLRYGVGIFSPITTVALRYDLGRYFYLEAASGLAASLDIFYTRDF